MHQSLFIQSPVDGHLGCFQFVAITNKAALNSPVYLCMEKKNALISVGVEWLCHILGLCLTF